MGFTLTKSRRRDPAAVDFGEYRLAVQDERARLSPTTQPLRSLDDVEAELARLVALATRGRG